MGPAAQKTGALQDFSVSHQVSKAPLQTAFLLSQTASFCATARPDEGSEGLAKAQPKPRLATEQRHRSAAQPLHSGRPGYFPLPSSLPFTVVP